MMRALAIAVMVCLPLNTKAIELDFDGYADLRVVAPPEEQSWLHGGLGKLRYAADSGDPQFEWGELVGEASARFTPELSAVVVGRIAPDQTKTLELIEAYLRYRPVSTIPWRWNFRLGAFFPPTSLENTEIGWTSPWTLTPSAINTWVGEELRTIGGSVGLEYRRESGVISLEGAVYGANDPAGILLAFRGWAMGDQPTGLQDHPRLPDALAHDWFIPTPWYSGMFKEIDDEPGWYAAAAWDERGVGRFQLMRYDNNADPTAIRGQFAWRTQFWSAGYAGSWGHVTLLTQGMIGRTDVEPRFYLSMTDFEAAYALIGWEQDNWRFAARFDGFKNDETRIPLVATYYNEEGHAYTIAANWEPTKWLRISGEAVRIIAKRPFREEAGLDEDTNETQLQLSLRVYH